MDKFEVKEIDLKVYILDTLYSSRIKLQNIDNAKFHHNTDYKSAPLICKHGIIPLLEQNKIGIRHDSQELLERMDDTESHINGNDGVSLAVLGLNDSYIHEDEYNPLNPSLVDFRVSSDIKAGRNTLHYFNEYIHYGNIGLEDIISLDIRLMEYIKSKEKQEMPSKKLVEMYNSLLESAKTIRQLESGLLIREMSKEDSFGIDVDKLSQARSLVLKK